MQMRVFKILVQLIHKHFSMYTRLRQFTPFFGFSQFATQWLSDIDKQIMFHKKKKYIFTNCSRNCIFVQNSVTFLFINLFERFWYSSRCQFRQKFIGKGFKLIKLRSTAVFTQHRLLKLYKARCAKNVIAYKMKTVHEKRFSKSTVNMYIGHFLHIWYYVAL